MGVRNAFGKMEEGEERRCGRKGICGDGRCCGLEVISSFVPGRTVWVCGQQRSADLIRPTSRITAVDTCSITFSLSP